MSTDHPGCTCWRLPTETGEDALLSWVCLHDEVRLVTKGGMAAQGWSMGASWWGPAERPEILMDVEGADGEQMIVSLDDISSVTPVGGYTERQPFLEALAEAIDNEFLTSDQGHLRWIVNAHETVEVEIRRESHECSPGPRPQ